MSTTQALEAMMLMAGQANDTARVDVCHVAAEIVDCFHEARRHGYMGTIMTWEPTAMDCQSIEDAVCFAPTAGQWRDALALARR